MDRDLVVAVSAPLAAGALAGLTGYLAIRQWAKRDQARVAALISLNEEYRAICGYGKA